MAIPQSNTYWHRSTDNWIRKNIVDTEYNAKGSGPSTLEELIPEDATLEFGTAQNMENRNKAVPLRKQTILLSVASVIAFVAASALAVFMIATGIPFAVTVTLAGLATLGVVVLGLAAIILAIIALVKHGHFKNALEPLRRAYDVNVVPLLPPMSTGKRGAGLRSTPVPRRDPFDYVDVPTTQHRANPSTARRSQQTPNTRYAGLMARRINFLSP